MDWDRIEAELLAEDATLPDGAIDDTGISDWQALLDLVRRRRWRCELTLDGEPVPAPRNAALLFHDHALGTLRSTSNTRSGTVPTPRTAVRKDRGVIPERVARLSTDAAELSVEGGLR